MRVLPYLNFKYFNLMVLPLLNLWKDYIHNHDLRNSPVTNSTERDNDTVFFFNRKR